MSTSSNEFTDLVNQLQKSPNDSALKQAIVKHLPKMMVLAQDNPLSMYHLAHIYPPKSSQYKQTMRQAANLGCTNAMLVMCQVLAESNDPIELKKAVHYLTMIEKSNDSYIKEQAKSLIDEYPLLMKTQQEQEQPNLICNHNHRFFAPQREKSVDVEFMENETCQM